MGWPTEDIIVLFWGYNHPKFHWIAATLTTSFSKHYSHYFFLFLAGIATQAHLHTPSQSGTERNELSFGGSVLPPSTTVSLNISASNLARGAAVPTAGQGNIYFLLSLFDLLTVCYIPFFVQSGRCSFIILESSLFTLVSLTRLKKFRLRGTLVWNWIPPPPPVYSRFFLIRSLWTRAAFISYPWSLLRRLPPWTTDVLVNVCCWVDFSSSGSLYAGWCQSNLVVLELHAFR